MTETTLVSYLKDSITMLDETPVGLIILNYYVNHGCKPNSNVVRLMEQDGTYESLYNYDLEENTLADIFPAQIVLTHTAFENPKITLEALIRFRSFLLIQNLSDFNNREILNEVDGYIRALSPKYLTAVTPAKRHGDTVDGGHIRPHAMPRKPVPIKILEIIRPDLPVPSKLTASVSSKMLKPILVSEPVILSTSLRKSQREQFERRPSGFIPSASSLSLEEYSSDDEY